MTDRKLEFVQRKTRRRLVFTAVHLVLYFSFMLNWTETGGFLREHLGTSPVTGSILMFVALIVIFIALEFLFIALGREAKQ